MTDSMIERVADAIARSARAVGGGYVSGHEFPWEDAARAAIEAMRTPTKEIIEAGGVAMDDALDGDWESDADGNRHDYSWIRSGAQTDVWRAP